MTCPVVGISSCTYSKAFLPPATPQASDVPTTAASFRT